MTVVLRALSIWRTEVSVKHPPRIKNHLLVSLMARRGLNSERLACLSGLSRGSLSLTINRRTTPLPETVRKLRKVLNCSAADIGLEPKTEGAQ